MSNRFVGVQYDPVQDKLYAPRKIEGIDRVLLTPAANTVVLENHGDVYTLSVDDADSILLFGTVDAVVTLTSGAYRVGSKISLLSGDSNQITLSGSGVTLYSTITNTSTANTYRNSFANAKIDLTCVGTDKWVVEGDVTADENKNYVLTSSGASHYIFNGSGLTDAEDPALTLSVGQFMEIDNQAGAGHPFAIKKGNVSGAVASDGPAAPGWARIDNNNSNTSSDKIRVSFKESGDYYYICTAHVNMKGSITVS